MPATNKFECFNCGEYFLSSESAAANTPPEHAKTYCSRVCYDLDTENMNREIEQAKLEQESPIENPQAPENRNSKIESRGPNTEHVNIGGFNIKIPKIKG